MKEEDDRGNEKNDGNKEERKTKKGIKPWSCAKVEFKILPGDKSQTNRLRNLKKMKTVAQEGICSTPYVEVMWEDGSISPALLDTGAQWSLLTEQELTDDERSALSNSGVIEGRGVSGEKIPVVGEIWRDVLVGGVRFENHRFIVVSTMVCRVILGIAILPFK